MPVMFSYYSEFYREHNREAVLCVASRANLTGGKSEISAWVIARKKRNSRFIIIGNDFVLILNFITTGDVGFWKINIEFWVALEFTVTLMNPNPSSRYPIESSKAKITSSTNLWDLMIFTAVTRKFTVFWGLIPCNLVDRYRRFGLSHCLLSNSKSLWAGYSIQHPFIMKMKATLSSETSVIIYQTTLYHVLRQCSF
jgi:hypothetical protein